MNAEPQTRVLPADPAAIETASACLAAGGLVAFPTETVYGLGADATQGEAVARLYAAKGRPAFNPLISHVAGLEAARTLARFNPDAEQLAGAFWPGPLTLVLPKQPDCPVSDLATAGLDSIALRIPAQRTARALLTAFGKPVVAPSANRSGHVSPTDAKHVLADLRGRIDLILDDGPCPVGVESTIVGLLGEPTLLRPGGLPRADIERVLGRPLRTPDRTVDEDAPLAPGMLASHYAPRATMRLNVREPREGEALLAFGPAPAFAGPVLNLSPSGDLVEAAAKLFSHLRRLDAAGVKAIAVMPVPNEGLGEAINDRLARAAAPKA
ncbi:L-threonylcarbamoyladenylate synthase [Pseudolabrys sp. FHR47]|uniref:L-threonylcarbamoyladenylate synthase n=1 Tax=Pseudolabrys sp. FHR47 TaxID=2562284 RepID=UPI0010BEC3BD|nr:L-threonylcarbamoyladenylate synthase [Pseudolabrys sp. FHR47]